ncbi:MAG: acyltransferase family protein [bacterium]
MSTNVAQANVRKFNFHVSYLNGFALISIIFIHLIDWSNLSISPSAQIIKDFLRAGVILFVFVAGAVTFIAYEGRTLIESTKRLLHRGIETLFFYYLYSLIKLFIFNFSTQPFYEQFIGIGKFSFLDILTFRSFSVPITILITFAFLFMFSPVLLYIHKKTKNPIRNIALLIVGLLGLNYLTTVPTLNNSIIKFLYSDGFVFFPLALWIVPFALGFFVAQNGFEKQKKKVLIVSGLITLFYGVIYFVQQKSLLPYDYEFPLSPYFISSGTFFASLLLYLFWYLEHTHKTWIMKIMAGLRLLGDNTLNLYLFHWIVIDCTIWMFSPRTDLILVSVPLFFVLYFIFNREKYATYYISQKGLSG